MLEIEINLVFNLMLIVVVKLLVILVDFIDFMGNYDQRIEINDGIILILKKRLVIKIYLLNFIKHVFIEKNLVNAKILVMLD